MTYSELTARRVGDLANVEVIAPQILARKMDPVLELAVQLLELAVQLLEPAGGDADVDQSYLLLGQKTEDLLQPWIDLVLFNKPRIVHFQVLEDAVQEG